MDPAALAAEIAAEACALAPASTPEVRATRRRWSRALRLLPAREVLDVAIALRERHNQRFLAYELIRFHPGALALVDRQTAERLGQSMASWGEVDMFGTLVAGQAWRRGQIDDATLRGWAGNADRWWRRAALVSTVPLNVRNQGGTGDSLRTLAVCQLLLDDRDEMVVKALSWALRELLVHDRTAVADFVSTHRARLAPRVLRDVSNKLRTGLKTPRTRTTLKPPDGRTGQAPRRVRPRT
jgi:3-methyladenine DNA glycosylase AlkD